mmetsp:Transcript_42827/g.66697  ORF Transcript_42827/g.66697 Transcript_42827/m.66697 type:complete len:80 (-) Transcript_42827:1383-1622(-)
MRSSSIPLPLNSGPRNKLASPSQNHATMSSREAIHIRFLLSASNWSKYGDRLQSVCLPPRPGPSNTKIKIQHINPAMLV